MVVHPHPPDRPSFYDPSGGEGLLRSKNDVPYYDLWEIVVVCNDIEVVIWESIFRISILLSVRIQVNVGVTLGRHGRTR